jgi:hypothetical protein
MNNFPFSFGTGRMNFPREVTRAPAASPFHRNPQDWTRRSHLELGAYLSAAGSARGHARNVLAEWRLRHLREATERVISELVANSVAATQAIDWPALPPVRLWLLSHGTSVLVHVWDAIVAVPRPRTAAPEDENGRGLAIVEAFSAQWGHHRPPAPPGGKVTWALITSAGDHL